LVLDYGHFIFGCGVGHPHLFGRLVVSAASIRTRPPPARQHYPLGAAALVAAMTSRAAILAQIQALADQLGGDAQVALGTPGSHVANSAGEVRPTGQAWDPATRTLSLIAQGHAGAHAAARSMITSGPLLATDGLIVLAQNNVTVTLPAAAAEYLGTYTVKALGTTGGAVTGTIDGAPATLPCASWACVQLLCDGTKWLWGNKP